MQHLDESDRIRRSQEEVRRRETIDTDGENDDDDIGTGTHPYARSRDQTYRRERSRFPSAPVVVGSSQIQAFGVQPPSGLPTALSPAPPRKARSHIKIPVGEGRDSAGGKEVLKDSNGDRGGVVPDGKSARFDIDSIKESISAQSATRTTFGGPQLVNTQTDPPTSPLIDNLPTPTSVSRPNPKPLTSLRATRTAAVTPIALIKPTEIDEDLPPHLIPNSYTYGKTLRTHTSSAALTAILRDPPNDDTPEERIRSDTVLTIDQIPEGEDKLPHVLRLKPGDILATPEAAYNSRPRTAGVVGVGFGMGQPLNPAPAFGTKPLPTPHISRRPNTSTGATGEVRQLAPSLRIDSSTRPNHWNSIPFPRPHFGSNPRSDSNRAASSPETEAHAWESSPPAGNNQSRRLADRRACSTANLQINPPPHGTALVRHSSTRVDRPLPKIPDAVKSRRGTFELIVESWSNLLAKAAAKRAKKKEEKKVGAVVVGFVDHTGPTATPTQMGRARSNSPTVYMSGGTPRVEMTAAQREAGEVRAKARKERMMAKSPPALGVDVDSPDAADITPTQPKASGVVQGTTLAEFVVTPPDPRKPAQRTPPPRKNNTKMPWPGAGEIPLEYQGTFSPPSLYDGSSEGHGHGREEQGRQVEVSPEVLQAYLKVAAFPWEYEGNDPDVIARGCERAMERRGITEKDRNVLQSAKSKTQSKATEQGKEVVVAGSSKLSKAARPGTAKKGDRPSTAGSLKLGFGGMVLPRFW